MSITRARLRSDARTLTCDVMDQAGQYAGPGDHVLNVLINSCLHDVLNTMSTGRVPPGTTIVTLVAGTDAYSLGGVTPIFTAIKEVKHRETGRLLGKATKQQLESWKQGVNPPTGPPQSFDLYEKSSDNTLWIQLFPVPATAQGGQHIDIECSIGAIDLVLDTDIIYFQDPLQEACKKRVAAECILMTPPDKRRVDEQIAARWLDDFRRMLGDEQRRLAGLRGQRHVTLVRR